jgi:Transposase
MVGFLADPGAALQRVKCTGMVKASKSRYAMSTTTSATSAEEAPIKYVCGIDIGSQACAGCICRPNKSVVVKPMTFANARQGWQVLVENLSQLDARPSQILIGMEATSRSGEDLYHELEQRGYVLWRLASQANASVS